MSTCLLWMSLWPHISAHPQLSDRRQRRAIRPSHAEPHLHSLDKPSSLHSMAELQVFQAKMLANEEASLDSASLRDLMKHDRPGSTRHQSHCPSHRAFDVKPRSGDQSAGKRSYRKHSSSPEQVRLLQPLLSRPQKRRRPATYSRFQTPELRPDEKVVQDDHFETDPNMPRGLV